MKFFDTNRFLEIIIDEGRTIIACCYVEITMILYILPVFSLKNCYISLTFYERLSLIF